MAGLFIHFCEMWGLACDARDRAIGEAAKKPSAWTADATVAIVLAAATAEAFINELAESIQMTINVGDAATLSPAVRAFADAHKEIESAKESLTLKYLIASQTLSGTMLEKGANPYQDFALLVTLRNDLMHLKPKDRFVQSAAGAHSVEPKGYITSLQDRGLARGLDQAASMSWFNILQTAKMAEWACETAKQIILAVLRFFPDDPVPWGDLARMFKQFRGASPSLTPSLTDG